MAAAATVAQIERSLVQPGLRSLAAARGALLPSGPPVAFQPPELLAESFAAEGSAEAAFATSAVPGGDILTVGLASVFRRLAHPLLDKAGRASGTFATAVQFGGAIGAAYIARRVTTGALANSCSRLWSIMLRVPGASSPVGILVAGTVAAVVGDKVGELAVAAWKKLGELLSDPPEPLVSMLCIRCNERFTEGSGREVAVLSCGHACLCGSAGDGGQSCVDAHLAARPYCPLCPPAHAAETAVVRNHVM